MKITVGQASPCDSLAVIQRRGPTTPAPNEANRVGRWKKSPCVAQGVCEEENENAAGEKLHCCGLLTCRPRAVTAGRVSGFSISFIIGTLRDRWFEQPVAQSAERRAPRFAVARAAVLGPCVFRSVRAQWNVMATSDEPVQGAAL